MSPLIPFAITFLSVGLNSSDCRLTWQSTSPGADEVVVVDSIPGKDITVKVLDLLSPSGASRRIIATTRSNAEHSETPVYDDEHQNEPSVQNFRLPGETFIDAIDGGSWGEEGFFDRLYITDPRHNTLSVWLTVSDAKPSFSEAPEGGLILELSDCLTADVTNFDYAETERYILRNNQITYRIDDNGKITLTSIRPRTDDLRHFVKNLRIYDVSTDSSDPLDLTKLSAILRNSIPPPGYN